MQMTQPGSDKAEIAPCSAPRFTAACRRPPKPAVPVASEHRSHCQRLRFHALCIRFLVHCSRAEKSQELQVWHPSSAPGDPSRREGDGVVVAAECGRILDASYGVLSLEGIHAMLDSFCSISYMKPFTVHARRGAEGGGGSPCPTARANKTSQ